MLVPFVYAAVFLEAFILKAAILRSRRVLRVKIEDIAITLCQVLYQSDTRIYWLVLRQHRLVMRLMSDG